MSLTINATNHCGKELPVNDPQSVGQVCTHSLLSAEACNKQFCFRWDAMRPVVDDIMSGFVLTRLVESVVLRRSGRSPRSLTISL